jgi:plasmid maintenance system antidote protein VapI
MTNYKELMTRLNISYTDIAHELGCTELTARNKINGKTRITKPEEYFLDRLFNKKEKKDGI